MVPRSRLFKCLEEAVRSVRIQPVGLVEHDDPRGRFMRPLRSQRDDLVGFLLLDVSTGRREHPKVRVQQIASAVTSGARPAASARRDRAQQRQPQTQRRRFFADACLALEQIRMRNTALLARALKPRNGRGLADDLREQHEEEHSRYQKRSRNVNTVATFPLLALTPRPAGGC